MSDSRRVFAIQSVDMTEIGCKSDKFDNNQIAGQGSYLGIMVVEQAVEECFIQHSGLSDVEP